MVPSRTDTRRPDPAAEPPQPVVLIVDDEEPIRRLLARALGGEEYDLLLAANANEALERVISAGATVSVAVIDIHLQGSDGTDLARLLRLVQPGLIVLFTSGYGESEQTRVLHDPLLPKPFPPAQISQCIRDLLATGRCQCCDRLAGA